jgi:hypothetical protein
VTNIFLYLLLLITESALCQNTDSLKGISITYGRNHSSWGKPGVYATSETVEFTPILTHDFKITRYFRVSYSAGNNGNFFSSDTTELRTRDLETIPKAKIEYWLTQLKTNKENFTASFIGSQLKLPTKKEIFKAAKKYGLLWMLKGSDAEKASTRKAISDLQALCNFDSFIALKKPNTEYDMVVTDSYNGIRILTIEKNDTTEYQCQFFELLGQPITRYSHKNYSKGSKVVNLEANTSSTEILPKNSILKRY